MKQFNKNNNYKYNIAIIPGDGIGPEVINASLKVIRKALILDNILIKEKIYDWGSNYYKNNKLMMPKDGLEKLKKHDAIFFGAVGDEKIADDITLWGLRLNICQGLDQFANVRPSKYIEGINSPLKKEIAKKIEKNISDKVRREGSFNVSRELDAFITPVPLEGQRTDFFVLFDKKRYTVLKGLKWEVPVTVGGVYSNKDFWLNRCFGWCRINPIFYAQCNIMLFSSFNVFTKRNC